MDRGNDCGANHRYLLVLGNMLCSETNSEQEVPTQSDLSRLKAFLCYRKLAMLLRLNESTNGSQNDKCSLWLRYMKDSLPRLVGSNNLAF